MVIDGEDQKEELVHTLEEGKDNERSGEQEKGGGEGEGEEGAGDAQREGEMRGGAGGVDGTKAPGAGVPHDGDRGGTIVELAGPGAQGYAGGAGAADEDGGQRRAVASVEAGAEAGTAGGGTGRETDEAVPAPGEDPGREGGDEDSLIGCDDEEEEDGQPERAGTSAGGDDHRSPRGEDDRPGGGPPARGLDQDVLQVGEERVGGPDGGAEGEEWRPPPSEERPREGGIERGTGPVPGTGIDLGAEVPDQRTAG